MMERKKLTSIIVEAQKRSYSWVRKPMMLQTKTARLWETLEVNKKTTLLTKKKTREKKRNWRKAALLIKKLSRKVSWFKKTIASETICLHQVCLTIKIKSRWSNGRRQKETKRKKISQNHLLKNKYLKVTSQKQSRLKQLNPKLHLKNLSQWYKKKLSKLLTTISQIMMMMMMKKKKKW